MNYTERLSELIEQHKGVVSTKIITEYGIPRVYISSFIKKGILQRVDRGIYICKNYCINDRMLFFQMRYNEAIFSYYSALFLNRFLEEEPSIIDVTVKSGVNTTSLINSGAKVHSIKQELYCIGIINIENANGNIVKTYNIERTICDFIKNRKKLRNGFIGEILKKYNNDCGDLSLLIKYAEKFKIDKVLRNYLEML